MTEPLKIMGFAELRGESRYYGDYDRAELAPTWRDRLLKWFWPEGLRALFDLQAENRRLRTKLLEAVKACEDAGRIGLQLYDENELLRERLGKMPEQHIARMAAFDKLRREKAQVEDKLKRSYADYNKLREDVDTLVKKFGEQK
jgi:hypothetical protein